MTLLAILIATLGAGIGSVWLAAALMRLGWPAARAGASVVAGPHRLLSLAAGALLATAFMHLLPEAFETGEPHALFATLLAGIVFFFLLDKAELWHHGHEHHAGPATVALERSPGHAHDAHARHDLHAHAHGHELHDHGSHDHPSQGHGARARSGAWAVLTGDGLHCFGDGVLIASAFLAQTRLGFVAAIAVLAHEVPHHIGDLAVLRSTGNDRSGAVLKVSLAGAMTAIGGLAGFWLVDRLRDQLPYFLTIASSSFVYVALADLIPQLQRRLSARDTAAQVAWLAAGIALVTAASRLMH